MARHLCTFSGKYGDILWSLATVKRLSWLFSEKMDFACMPQYSSLLPLIAQQSYIKNAYVIPNWILMHSNYGDQPWNPPDHMACIQTAGVDRGGFQCKAGYDMCWHLGYRQHPGRTMGGQELQLIDYDAWQQATALSPDPLPFIETQPVISDEPYIAVAFNTMYDQLKKVFYDNLESKSLLKDVSQEPWTRAAALIAGAAGFVGCRSANYVIAHGVKQSIFTYEPHPARNKDGHLGYVFGCTYGDELCAPLAMPPYAAAAMANDWIRQRIKGASHETTETIAR